MSRIILTGSDGGLGRAIYNALVPDHEEVLGYDVSQGADVRNPSVNAEFVSRGVDVLINCAGVVRLNYIGQITNWEWNQAMDVNVGGIIKMTQHLLQPLRRSGGTILNIVSSAAHNPMRTSAAYCASKAAALMLTRQMARELSPGITVFSVSPNRLRGTPMSEKVDEQTAFLREWSEEEVTKRQLAASLTGEETPPEAVAELIAFLLSSKERHRHLTGCDITYGV